MPTYQNYDASADTCASELWQFDTHISIIITNESIWYLVLHIQKCNREKFSYHRRKENINENTKRR